MASHLSHAYTYRLPEEQQSAVEISLRFPRISSFRFNLFFPISQCSICGICEKKNLGKFCQCNYVSDGVWNSTALSWLDWVSFWPASGWSSLNNIWVIFLNWRKKITEVKIFSCTFFKMKIFHYKVPSLLSVTSIREVQRTTKTSRHKKFKL